MVERPRVDWPIERRFWAKVKKTRGCWHWLGVVGRDGYGHFYFSKKRRVVGAHRVAWFLATGRWPKKDVLHRPKCNTKTCVRKSHLYEGTDLENARDRSLAGDYSRMAIRFRGEGNPNSCLSDAQRRHVWQLRSELSVAELRRRFKIGRTTVYRIFRGFR